MSDRGRGPNAAERAYEGIRNAIIDGDLTPGTMLSENDLARSFAMSRTPVRTALARLQDEGWVTIYAQRGALVRDLTPDEIRESAELRHALESAGVQRSTPERRADLEEALAANIAAQEEALLRADVHGFAALALRFHRAFVEASGNSMMLAAYDRLQARQHLSILGSADRLSGDPEQVMAEHRTLLEDASRADWIAFAIHLDEHQARSHGIETGLRIPQPTLPPPS